MPSVASQMPQNTPYDVARKFADLERAVRELQAVTLATGTSLAAKSSTGTNGVTIRTGGSAYFSGKGQAVIELRTGVADETSPAEVVAISDGPLATDNDSLLIVSPAKGGRNRSYIQMFAADGDTGAGMFVGGVDFCNIMAGIGYIGTQTSQVIQFNVASGGFVTVNGTLTVNGVIADSVVTPSFLNNWTNYDVTTFDAFSARKDASGYVTISGLVKCTTGSGLVTTVIANLPAGYRPAKRKGYLCPALGAPIQVNVAPSGDVWCDSISYGPADNSSSGFIYLDSIRFRAFA